MSLIGTTQGLMRYTNILDDGITHVNVYSAGQTKLGYIASNFSEYGFEHPVFGKFFCMEGYWHWLSTGQQHEEFRTLKGRQAKYAKAKYKKVAIPNFEELILEGIHCKFAQNPDAHKALLEEHPYLPLAHYYVKSGIVSDKYESSAFWLTELSKIRNGASLMYE